MSTSNRDGGWPDPAEMAAIAREFFTALPTAPAAAAAVPVPPEPTVSAVPVPPQASLPAALVPREPALPATPPTPGFDFLTPFSLALDPEPWMTGALPTDAATVAGAAARLAAEASPWLP